MIRGPLVLLAIGLAFVLLAGCSDSHKLQGKLVSQTTSPNGRVEALTTRYSGNATVSFVDRIYLKAAGDDHAKLVLKADKSDKVIVKWVNDRHLKVNVPCAQIFSYTNFFYVMKDGELVYPISIELVNQGLCRTQS